MLPTVYNKLFSKIVRSSIWLESTETRLVWLTCLAIMDRDGFVDCAAVGNLASTARVSLKSARAAVARLEGPDADSSDQEFEGRRLERVEGGWMVINAKKYRDIVTAEVQRERTRIRVARSRAKKRDGNASVLPVPSSNTSVTQSEAEADTEVQADRTREAVLELVPTESGAIPHRTRIASPPVLTYRTAGKQQTWDLTIAQVDRWKEQYPALDILAECRKAQAYTEAKSLKTAKGMPAFLVGWLNKAQNWRRSDNGGVRGATPAPERQEWSCDHLPHCSGQWECIRKSQIAAAKA